MSIITINVIGSDAAELLERIDIMSASLDRLTAEVQESRTVNESALALISGLAQEIRDRLGDDAAMEALADDLDAQQAEMAAGVAAGTVADPSEPDPQPEPEPAPVEEEPAPVEEPAPLPEAPASEEAPANTGEGSDGNV
jgi:hypothetical protein